MNANLLFILPLVSALGCGPMAGVFFAFSTFIMNALARIPAAQGIAAMQSINLVVINSWFGAIFFGTAVACLFLIVSAGLRWHKPGAVWMLVGSLLYLIGVMGVTIVCNVPQNDVLATINPAGAESARLWSGYVTAWTAWNHVRTVAALGATAALIMALVFHTAGGRPDHE